MKQPLFSVGEKVIRQAKTYTYANGEYVVEAIITAKEMSTLHGGVNFGTTTDYYYKLSGFKVELIGTHTRLSKNLFSEFSAQEHLRKIHKPSQFSFDQLINEIKCPSNIA